jgi:hypothetical protein
MTHEKLYKELFDQRISGLMESLDVRERSRILREKEEEGKHPEVQVELIELMRQHQDMYHLSIKWTTEELLDKYSIKPKSETPVTKEDLFAIRNTLFALLPIGKMDELESQKE